jgi:hypothetical protein
MNGKDYSLEGRIRGKSPPKHPGIELEVIRITSTENRLFYLLGDMPWGADFHWRSNRSLPCAGEETCKYCLECVAKKWRAYVHALEQAGTNSRPVIIELTHTAIVMLDVLLVGQPHRGAVVQMRKTKGGKHGRFLIDVLPRRVDPVTLPVAVDPETRLRKLWELNEKRSVSA